MPPEERKPAHEAVPTTLERFCKLYRHGVITSTVTKDEELTLHGKILGVLATAAAIAVPPQHMEYFNARIAECYLLLPLKASETLFDLFEVAYVEVKPAESTQQ